ncbi:MAG TPA: DsrE family protein [Saprospiraceae bacterium]|nr:DsrE family protein [Saprospiraceae bacterium]
MKTFAFLIMAFMALMPNDATAQGANHKVVFQFTLADSMQQKAFSNQLKNLRKHWPDAQIEVVAYNQGIDFLMTKRTRHHDIIADLKKAGVRFVVCQNTMNQRNIKADELIQEAEIVPAGIAEIVEKQEQGWSYIKGGF